MGEPRWIVTQAYNSWRIPTCSRGAFGAPPCFPARSSRPRLHALLRAGEFFHAYFRQVPAIVNRGALMLPMEQARIASINIGDIAEAAAAILTAPAGHEGKIYPLTGPEALTMAEVAQRLSRVIGKEVRYVNVSPDDARKARLAAGMTPYMADALSTPRV